MTEAHLRKTTPQRRVHKRYFAGQEAPISEADGGDISWDIDMSAAEGTDPAEEGQADIDWDADPTADGDISAQNIDWDIGMDNNVGQEASDVAQTGEPRAELDSGTYLAWTLAASVLGHCAAL